MGLTLHFSLHLPEGNVAQARQLVEKLRQRALDLPFRNVSEVIEFTGSDCDFDRHEREGPYRWLLIQATQPIERDGYTYDVAPKRLLAFKTSPGEGSEPANFGLCLYPAAVPGHAMHGVKRVKTGISGGWYWKSFCKTQYASNPATGDIENFLRSHLSIVRLLDYARELGVLHGVTDEGGYWEGRDVKALVEEVGQWNAMIAGFVGGLKDLAGSTDIQSEITKFPDYEHLEAEGRKKEDATPGE
jgi:hypothetical protein